MWLDSDSSASNTNNGDKHGSTVNVVAALTVNSLILGAKLFAFVYGGGFGGAHRAMFAEALHSGGDTAAQGLLLGGILHGKKKAEKDFPLGYGRARFMWSFFAAAIVLGLGVESITQGVDVITQQIKPHVSWVAIGVFLFAAFGEGTVLCIALRNAWKAKKGLPLMTYLKRFDDPSSVAVILEDAVAVTGITIALAGIGLTELTGSPIYDGVAVILIGVLMIGIALFLGTMNFNLIVGRPSEQTRAGIKEVLDNDKRVQLTHLIDTERIGVESVRAHVKIELKEEELLKFINGGTKQRISQISKEEDLERLMKVLASVKDEIELAIRRKCPEIARVIVEIIQ